MSITTQITVAATAETIIITAPGALRGPVGDVTPEAQILVERAETAAAQSQDSAGQAASSAAQAGDSASQAGNSAESAAQSAAAASDSETAAGLSESSAQTSASSATDSAAAAASSQGAAQTSASQAQTSATYAGQSAAAAADSASSAQEDADATAARVARFLAPSAIEPAQRDNGQPLQVGDQWPSTVDGKVYSWSGSAWVALDSGAQALEEKLADETDPSKGSGVVGHLGGTVFSALSWLINPAQFKLAADPDDTQSFRRMHAFVASAAGVRPIVMLSGDYFISGGFDPTVYEWADVTWVCNGATINAVGLTGDNGVLQVGSNFTQTGRLSINISGTAAGGNGFVRTGVTIGRWWNAAQRVEDFSIESIVVTTSTGVNCFSISGSARRGKIGRIGCFGSFSIGFLAHWSGLPNDISPVTTYHPNGIIIDEVFGDSSTESLVTFSAVGGVKIGRINGNDNAKNFMCIAGDWGAKFATAAESLVVGNGIEVSEFACTATRAIGIHIIGQPGLIVGNTLAMPVKIGTGFISGAAPVDGVGGGAIGILHSNVNGGVAHDIEISGFTHGVSPGAFVYNTIFRGTRAIGNRNNGFRFSAAADARKGIVLDHVVARDNNTLAAGGIAQIEIGSTADGLHLINPKVGTNNTSSNGIHLTGTAKNCIIESPVGEGFTGSRYVILNDSSPDTNNIICDIQSDSANRITPISTPILIRIDGTGRRVFSADAIPTVGTYALGDKLEFNRPATVGFEGATCSVSGTPGTWKTLGSVTP